MHPERVITGTKAEISQALISVLRAGDWVLVKGSRGMKMEEVVQALKDWADKSA